jgi:hypothetical protein
VAGPETAEYEIRLFLTSTVPKSYMVTIKRRKSDVVLRRKYVLGMIGEKQSAFHTNMLSETVY